MSRSSEPLGAVLTSLTLLLLIIPWSMGGAYDAPEEGAADPHAGHGGGGGMLPGEFMGKTVQFETLRWNDSAGMVVAGDRWHMESSDGGMWMDPVVYIAASQWAFYPDEVQLKAGVDYDFKIMSMDVYHGASINTDSGSQMIRLIPGVVHEQTLNFEEPGTYILYCSYYCGEEHDGMSGKLVVV